MGSDKRRLIAHLMRRAGFGATSDDLDVLDGLDYDRIVDDLIDPPDASWMGDHLVRRFHHEQSGMISGFAPGEYWLYRMVTTKAPLVEKATLFWHSIFATGYPKVVHGKVLSSQIDMFRRNGLGRLDDLLVELSKDPAMIVWLDNEYNHSGAINENYGRELLELFSMGVGNYSEEDIKEAARAFTGWTIGNTEYMVLRSDRDSDWPYGRIAWHFEFKEEDHDNGEKTFLGRTGAFNGDDIIDIILDTPVTADYISAKLYRFFVREELDDSTRVALGATFRDAGYELKPLLRRVFLSRDFYSPASYATQVKSPVHLVVSTYRKLGLTALPTIPDFGRLTARLGQTLFNPPNVAGWAGGRTWITPASLLERGNLFRDVLLPDTDGFWAPDRALPGIYARVGERIEQGLNITAATQEGDAESSMLADRDEDYNTRYGGYMGYVMAYERLNLVFRRTADLDLAQMLQDARATTVEEVVDHFVQRFLRVPLGPDSRTVLVEHLRGDLGDDRIPTTSTSQVERALRSLLYLVLSAPEYQLA